MLKEEIKKIFDGLYERYDPPSAELSAKELVSILVEKKVSISLEEINLALTELVKEEYLEIVIITSELPLDIFVHFKKS